jgi:hypothetical protein
MGFQCGQLPIHQPSNRGKHKDPVEELLPVGYHQSRKGLVHAGTHQTTPHLRPVPEPLYLSWDLPQVYYQHERRHCQAHIGSCRRGSWCHGCWWYTGAYGSPAYTTFTLASAPTLSQGSTFPLIFASSSPGEPNALLDTTGSKTWYLGCGIVRYTQVAGGASYTTPGTFTHQSTTVRLYVPTYTLSEQAESALLEINGAVKTIVYEDILQYNIPATPSGSSVNQLLTNGVVSPVKLVILPMFTAATAGNGTPFAAPYASPFAAEPGLTSPLTAITNFNLLLSGETVLMLNQQYDFQNFIDEFSHSGINGGVTDGLSSGLVDEYTWSNSYRAYVVDIERRVSAGDAVVPKSIQVLFQNLSAREVQYFCFVVVRRAFSIDLRNGSLVS